MFLPLKYAFRRNQFGYKSHKIAFLLGVLFFLENCYIFELFLTKSTFFSKLQRTADLTWFSQKYISCLPIERRQICAKFAPQSSTLCLLGRPLSALNKVFQFFIKSHKKHAVHAKTPERKFQKCNNFLEKSNFSQTFHEVPLNRSH